MCKKKLEPNKLNFLSQGTLKDSNTRFFFETRIKMIFVVAIHRLTVLLFHKRFSIPSFEMKKAKAKRENCVENKNEVSSAIYFKSNIVFNLIFCKIQFIYIFTFFILFVDCNKKKKQKTKCNIFRTTYFFLFFTHIIQYLSFMGEKEKTKQRNQHAMQVYFYLPEQIKK